MIDYGNYDSDEIEITPGLQPGAYKAIAIDEEIVDTSSGNKMLRVNFEVMEGDSKGLRQSANFNLFHSNPKAKKIAEEDLKKLAQATHKKIDNNNPIKGREVVIHVRPQKNAPEYNEIHKFTPVRENETQDDEIPF